MYGMHGKADVGDQAPGFRAQDVTYHDINLVDYRGRNDLVLFFYSSSQCQACREEIMQMAKKFDDIVRLDGDVIVIGTDGFVEARDMALDLHLPFHVISDPGGRISQNYGVYDNAAETASPALFLIDKNGVVRYRKMIREPADVTPADEIVDRLRGMGTSHGESAIRSIQLD